MRLPSLPPFCPAHPPRNGETKSRSSEREDARAFFSLDQKSRSGLNIIPFARFGWRGRGWREGGRVVFIKIHGNETRLGFTRARARAICIKHCETWPQSPSRPPVFPVPHPRYVSNYIPMKYFGRAGMQNSIGAFKWYTRPRVKFGCDKLTDKLTINFVR